MTSFHVVSGKLPDTASVDPTYFISWFIFEQGNAHAHFFNFDSVVRKHVYYQLDSDEEIFGISVFCA